MNFRYYNTTGLIILILLLAFVIDSLLKDALIPFMHQRHIELLRAPGNASLIGMFLILYDKVLWKWPVFSFLVNVPDMRGRYIGKIKYEFDGILQEKECAVEVTQTASKIKVHSYFSKENSSHTSSKSLIENIEEEDGFYYVHLYYLNNGSKDTKDLDGHEGANMLKFIPKKENKNKTLTGHYFTNRKIQTRGSIEVEFNSKKLKGTF